MDITVLAENIQWEADSNLIELPKSVLVKMSLSDIVDGCCKADEVEQEISNYVSDYLSDYYGFTHKGFTIAGEE